MSEAIVNLKLSPADFDTVRDALRDFVIGTKAVLKDANVPVADRAKAQDRAILAEGLLRKLGR